MDKIITCGPFVGSFFEEMINFRPFVQWVESNLIYDDLFVFTHFNRSFLYNKNVIPIYEQYSFDDSRQKNHLNQDISSNLYTMIWKSLKNDVIRISGYQPKEILSLMNKYPKNKIRVSLYNKQFNKVKDSTRMSFLKDTIAFIPHKSQSKKKLKHVLNHLQSQYNVVVLGDSKIHFNNLNYLNSNYKMILDMYHNIIKIINNVKAVICPLSDWTFLSNLQNVPVFSWGEGNLNPYKTGGVYNFNNDSYVIANTKTKHIISGIDRFLKGIE